MRLNAFAMQLQADPNPGAYPLDMTEFPTSFTLDEYVAWYFRVKSWDVTVNISCSFDLGGTTYSFSRLTSETVQAFTNGMTTEARSVQDTYARAQFSDSAIPYSLVTNDSVFLSVFEDDSNDPVNNIRLYWTGENGGAKGDVIPRIKIGASYSIDDSDITPAGSGGLEFHFTSYPTAFPNDPNGTENNVFSFAGKSFGAMWDMLNFSGFAPAENVTFSIFSVLIEPAEYFEFSDGLTPLWNAATGVQLVDPLPHD